MRIVSLLPSATDIITALGAAGDLVGVSHSCGVASLPALTSTWIDTQAKSAEIDRQVRSATAPIYRLDVDTLASLKPDVVVSQSLCDVCAVPAGDVMQAVSTLPSRPLLIDLAPQRLADVPACFSQVADAIGRASEAQMLQRRWQDTFAAYRHRYDGKNLRVAFLDWLDPPFAAGHWVPDLLEWVGVDSALAKPGEASYTTTWEAVLATNADLVVAACCGMSTAAAERERLPLDNVYIVDGHQQFSRPSPSLMQSVVTLSDLLDQHCASERLTNV